MLFSRIKKDRVHVTVLEEIVRILLKNDKGLYRQRPLWEERRRRKESEGEPLAEHRQLSSLTLSLPKKNRSSNTNNSKKRHAFTCTKERRATRNEMCVRRNQKGGRGNRKKNVNATTDKGSTSRCEEAGTFPLSWAKTKKKKENECNYKKGERNENTSRKKKKATKETKRLFTWKVNSESKGGKGRGKKGGGLLMERNLKKEK